VKKYAINFSCIITSGIIYWPSNGHFLITVYECDSWWIAFQQLWKKLDKGHAFSERRDEWRFLSFFSDKNVVILHFSRI